MHNYSVSFGTKRLKNPPFLNTHITLPDRNMEAGAGYQGCLPSCELQIHSRRSVSGGLAKWKFVDCACKLRDLEIAHVCYAISGFWECATQSRDRANSQIARTYTFITLGRHHASNGGEAVMEVRQQWRWGSNGGEAAMKVRQQWRWVK